MGTKILHVSDTHLGKAQYGSDIRVSDYSRAFQVTVDIAIDEDVSAMIHTGDLFDSRTPSTKAVSDAFEAVKRLNDNNIDFLGIVGNHERKWDNQWMDILRKFDNVRRLDTDPFIIDDKISIYGFDSIRDSEWDNMDFELSEPQDDTFVCVCMHELFEEILRNPLKADRELSEVIERLNIKPDFMPLGDYHAGVEEEVDGVSAFYAGATERTSVTQDDPTVRVIEVSDDKFKTSWKKIQDIRENVPRPFYPVDISLSDSTTRKDIKTRIRENVTGNDIEDSIVVVNLEGSNESPITSSEVYDVMESIGVMVSYVSDKRTPEALEFDSVDAADPTSIDIDEMIDKEIGDDVSGEVSSIDKNVVRDLTVNKSDIRDMVDERFEINQGDKNED